MGNNFLKRGNTVANGVVEIDNDYSYYIDANGDKKTLEFYYVKEGYDGNEKKSMVPYLITKDFQLVLLDQELVTTQSANYQIGGRVAPPGGTIVYAIHKDDYDSYGMDWALDPKNAIASGVADENGNFITNTFSGRGDMILWMTIQPGDLSIACFYETHLEIIETEEQPTEGQYLLWDWTLATMEMDSTMTKYNITGKMPSHCSTVYMSVVPESLFCPCTEGYAGGGHCEACGGSGVLITNTPECIQALSANAVAVYSNSGGASSNFYFNEVLEYKTQIIVVWSISEKAEPDSSFQITDCYASSSENVCLSWDTLVTMADGSRKYISEIKEGEYVIDMNGEATRVRKVVHGSSGKYHTYYHFSDGTIIDEVENHRFFNVEQGFWQLLKNWNIGEHAKNEKGELVTFLFKERIEEEKDKYSIWTDQGSYYANGLLTGPMQCNKMLLSTASTELVVNMIASLEEEYLLELAHIEGVFL